MISNRISPIARRYGLYLVLLGALLASSFPYLYGLAVRPTGTLYWAIPLINYSDANQYLALTRQAVDGRILLADPFTQQPHAPRLFLPAVLAEAAVCRTFGVAPIVAFQVSRVISGSLLLLACYWLGTLLLNRFRQRALYVGLLCFSAGASWYLEQLRIPWVSGDVYQPEANTFYTLGNLPHLSLASALLTTLFATLAFLETNGLPGDANDKLDGQRGSGWILALAGGCAFVLAWTHPFDLVTYTLGAGSYGLVRLIQERELPRDVLRHVGTVFLGAAPAAVYLFWLVQSDPVYRALANDVSNVQDFRFYLIAHGFLIVPALGVLFSTEGRRRFLLPLCWVACVFLFLLTPFRMGGKQARLLGGVHAPLSLLAAAGLDLVAERLTRGRPRSAQNAAAWGIGAGFLMLTGTGVLGMIQRQTKAYAVRGPGFYLSPAVQELFRYLDANGDRSQLTLGGPHTGEWAPVLADTRVFHGHWHMTLHEPQKRAERDWFFRTPADPLRKAAWLRENGITWVVCFPWEWGNSLVSPDSVPGLRRVYSTPEILLYRFEE